MNIDKVCKDISKELNIDFNIVRKIVMYEFKFIVDTMKNNNDTRDILINKLFKFKLKSRFKEDKNTKYTSK